MGRIGRRARDFTLTAVIAAPSPALPRLDSGRRPVRSAAPRTRAGCYSSGIGAGAGQAVRGSANRAGCYSSGSAKTKMVLLPVVVVSSGVSRSRLDPWVTPPAVTARYWRPPTR